MFTALLVLALGWTGVMVLIKICEPLNAYRIFLLIITVGLIMLTTYLLGGSLGIVSFDTKDPIQLASLLFLISLILVTYFTVSMVMKLLITLKVMTE